MKKIQIVLFIFLSLLFSNCEKEETSTQINISYELFDDVSPVRIKFSTTKNLHWSEWRVNDAPVHNDTDNNRDFEYGFYEEGIINVSVDARGSNGEIYFGNLDLEIPGVAKKLMVYGYYFRDAYKFNIAEDTLSFNFGYFNGIEYSFAHALVDKGSFVNKDSVIFDTALVLDISGFNEIALEKLNLHFSIAGLNSGEIYFKTNRGLRDLYYYDRPYASNYIYMDNLSGTNRERIFIVADWTQ